MRAVSLFSNCGAGDVGYAAAGFTFDSLAEIDERRLAVANRNHTSAVCVVGDLRKTWPTVVNGARARDNNPLALLSACPPCQGMSSARGKRGSQHDADAGSSDDRNLLVLPIAHVATALRPRMIVVENVTAFLTRKVRHPVTGVAISAANLLISILEQDYHVFPLVTDLSDYGVPQTRRRAFLTFIRCDELCLPELLATGKSPYPQPTHARDQGGSPIKLRDALQNLRLSELDAASREAAHDPSRPMHCVPVWTSERYTMIAAIPANSGASAWQSFSCATCGPVKPRRNAVNCPFCGTPLPRPIMRSKGRRRLIRGFHNSTYRRMHPDVPAQTITTASGRIGGNYTIHPWENRVLSPLECAYLQTFPETFAWGDALEENGHTRIRAMIGEAVPPLFTRQHGAALVALLQSEKTRQLLNSSDVRCARAERALAPE